MRAAWFETFGAAHDVLQVGERETPRPGPGEVLVRLRSSGVNPSDTKKRGGAFPDLLDGGFVIPNSDGAGVVEAVGDGVDEGRIGERVWVYQAQFARRFGTAAQYLAIDARRAPALPDNAGFDVGASIGIPAMTAHRAVFGDGPVGGQTLLVTGAAGRVGYYALQWAAQAGATVIATAGNGADHEALKAAGATRVVDHRDAQMAEAVLDATGGRPVDRIVEQEFGTNLAASTRIIRTGGVIASYGSARQPEPSLPFYALMYRDVTVHFIIVYAMPEAAKQQAVDDINAALRDGRLVHRIAEQLPLAEIARGNELVEAGGCRGAVLLQID